MVATCELTPLSGDASVLSQCARLGDHEADSYAFSVAWPTTTARGGGAELSRAGGDATSRWASPVREVFLALTGHPAEEDPAERADPTEKEQAA